MAKLGTNLAQLKGLVGYLITVQGDLSNITAPPFVLAPKSAIEVPSCWTARQSLFLRPASEPDPARRALLIAQNFACSLAGLVDLGSEYAGRKPLNPFLGELFLGTFLSSGSGNGGSVGSEQDGNENGVGAEGTRFVAEQVSHHPPVTACFSYNKHYGISSRGFAAQETSFSPANGVVVRQIGYAIIGDRAHEESHLMTLPTMYVTGLVSGQLQPELYGRCWISSSSGYVTSIDLEGQNALGLGMSHRITAVVHSLPGMEPVYRLTGQWNGEMSIEDVRGDAPNEKFRFDDVPATDLTLAPVAEQTAWESRRAWAEVLKGIREGDMSAISENKTAIEEDQRRRRHEEEEKGTPWEGLFFRSSSQDDEATTLLEQIPDSQMTFDAERTAGFWEFVGLAEAENLIAKLK